MKPYADNFEHLLDELSRIDRLICSYLKVFQAELSEPMDEFRGLIISESENPALLKSQDLETGRNILREFYWKGNEPAPGNFITEKSKA